MKLVNKLLKAYERVYPSISHLRGTYRLRKLLRTNTRLDSKILELEIFGTSLSAPSQSHGAIKYYFGSRNTDEINHLEYVLENIEKSDVFADIGSCYGLFSSVISDQTDADVYSYEPLKLNILFQKLNQELYNYDFSVNHTAVSDEKGSTQLNIGGNTKELNNSVELNDISSERETERSETVSKKCLDEELNHVDYVKIDVEGAELKVLKGMEKLLENSTPVLLLELHRSEALKKFNSSKKEVVNFLDSKGYQTPEKSLKGNQCLIIEPG